MTQARVELSVNEDALQEAINKFDLLGNEVFPHTARAIEVSASFIQRTWVNIAQGNDLSKKPEELSFNGSIDYANSIQIRTITPFNKMVFSDSPIGKRLAEGSPEYDMKPALVNGPKSRQAIDGHRYNIVPFQKTISQLKRMKVEGGQNAYAIAKTLTRQKIIGFKIDSEGKRRLVYQRWTKAKKLDTKHRFLAGMVRMETSAGKAQSSVYLTFRTVTLAQTGKWIRKAQPAWNIPQEVADQAMPRVKEFVEQALKRDLGI